MSKKNLVNVCKHCEKRVNSAVICEIICKSGFHPSCAKQAKVSQNDNKINCCKARGKFEVNCGISEIPGEMDENKIRLIIKETLAEILNPFKKNVDGQMKELKESMQFISAMFEEQKQRINGVLEETKKLRERNKD